MTSSKRRNQYPARERNFEAYRSNLAYDFDVLERQRVQETPQTTPRIRTITRPKVNVRPAERVSKMAVFGFVVAAAMLAMVLVSYAHLIALSDSVVSLQKELAVLERQNVTLTAEYGRTFDLDTVESAAVAAGMSKPGYSQIYYLDMQAPDSAYVYTNKVNTAAQNLFDQAAERVHKFVEYFT